METAVNTRLRRRWTRSLAHLALVFAVATAEIASVDAQAARKFAGRPVADVLRELQAGGEPIIFTNALVPPGLRVRTEPRAKDRLEIAREILEPHGLALKDGPGHTWLVVRSARQTPAAPGQRDARAATPAREEPAVPPPAGQAAIRIEEAVDVTDRLGDLSRQPSVYKLDHRQVVETAGSLDNLFLVLPMLPGAVATNDQEGKLAVRGGGPEHNVVLFDGVQIHSPQRAGDFGTSFVNPAVTAGVAFDASGLDAQHGGRLASVSVLESRNGAVDRRLAISGSAGLTSGDVLAEGRVPGTLSGSWWAAARGTYYKFVSDRFRGGGTPGFVDVEFKVHLRPGPRTELSLLGLIGKEGMAERTPMHVDALTRGILPETAREDIDVDNRLAAVNLRWTPGPRLTTMTTVTAYGSANRYYDDLGRNLRPFARDVRVADVGVRQRALLAWTPRHLFDVGVDARRVRTSWRMSGSAFSPQVRPVGPDTWGGLIEYDGPIDSRLDKTLLGAWLQDRIPLGAGVTIEPGARLDWNSFTGESALQPRVRLSTTLGHTVLWTGLAWQAQTPGHETMQQGYSYYDLTGPEASGLRNERSRQVVVGLAREVGATAIRIEAYRRALDRLLVQRQETERARAERLSLYVLPPDMPAESAVVEYRPTVHPASTGTGAATGLEILLQRSRGRVTGWVSYALSKAERELYGRTVPFEFDRRHAAAVALNVQLFTKVRLSASSQFATGFPLTPLAADPVFPQLQQIAPIPTPPFAALRTNGALVLAKNPVNPLRLSLLNSARAPGYARTDVRATFAVAPWLEVYGEIVNLFGRDNFHPTTEFRPGMRAEYEIAPGLPRLPTYGVRLRF